MKGAPIFGMGMIRKWDHTKGSAEQKKNWPRKLTDHELCVDECKRMEDMVLKN